MPGTKSPRAGRALAAVDRTVRTGQAARHVRAPVDVRPVPDAAPWRGPYGCFPPSGDDLLQARGALPRRGLVGPFPRMRYCCVQMLLLSLCGPLWSLWS